MNDLEHYFVNNSGRLIVKWSHFFDIYDGHFSRFRDQAPVVLESGFCHGGSLQMWKHYFGDNCRIFGVDIHPRTLDYQEDQIQIFIGDQEDRTFLRQLKEKIPSPDIIIDDGGHTMAQQINTFEELYPWVKDTGIYVCEDTHTSYWGNFDGGYRKPGTFIEYMKRQIINMGEMSDRGDHSEALFLGSEASVHCYDSVVAIEKSGSQGVSAR